VKIYTRVTGETIGPLLERLEEIGVDADCCKMPTWDGRSMTFICWDTDYVSRDGNPKQIGWGYDNEEHWFADCNYTPQDNESFFQMIKGEVEL
jgi:hypothetical protein